MTNCGHNNPDWARFCTQCGKNLHRPPCPRCAGICIAGTAYCPHCGENLAAKSVSNSSSEPLPAARQSYDLQALIQETAPAEGAENTSDATADRASQDAIRDLLKRRRK